MPDLSTAEKKICFLPLSDARFLVEMLTAMGKVSTCFSFRETRCLPGKATTSRHLPASQASLWLPQPNSCFFLPNSNYGEPAFHTQAHSQE